MKDEWDDANANFKWREGRRYASDNNYVLPVDDTEVDRLQIQHEVWRNRLGGNFVVPVKDVLEKGGKVLDMGCGSGTWTMEMAAYFPATTFLGIDANRLFPDSVMPHNCDFEVVDVTKPLPYADNTFDLVYLRQMISVIEKNQWTEVLKGVYRVIKPGGWIQFNEASSILQNIGPVTVSMLETVAKGLSQSGYDVSLTERLQELIKTAGFVEVNQTQIESPLGAWGGRHGLLHKEDFCLSFDSLKGWLVQDLGISGEKWDADIKTIQDEIEEYKTYGHLIAAYGKKAT